jgi:hypothetical protein
VTPAQTPPTSVGSVEAERLTSHRAHCDAARSRWAPLAHAADGAVGLLLGHAVSSALVLTALAIALAWMMA